MNNAPLSRFWMVVNLTPPPGVRNHPVVKHTSAALAGQEAERLARANPGQTFVVMESMCAAVVDGLSWTAM